jgi:hypothetical protein
MKMNKVILSLISAAIGGAVGYFVAYKRYKKKLAAEVEAIKKTQEDLTAKKIEEIKADEPGEGEDGDGKIDIVKEVADESEDEDYGDYDSDEREEALRDARKAFIQEMRDTYGANGHPYNIDEETYSTPDPDFEKDVLMIDEDSDRAYTEDGMELDDWHDAIGDLDYGTLEDDKKDEFGRIYVRSPREGKDFEITWSRKELCL